VARFEQADLLIGVCYRSPLSSDTRYREGYNPSTLDYVFTDESNLVDNRVGKFGRFQCSNVRQ